MQQNIGERIKEIREKRGMSVIELAKAIGVGRATIYRYENNEIEKMPLNALVPIAKALHVSPAYLMGWDEEIHSDWELMSEAEKEIIIAFRHAGAQTQRIILYALGINESPDIRQEDIT